VDSDDTALLQFRSGETDVFSVRGRDFQLLKREEERDQFTIYNLGQTLNNSFFAFNLSRARNPQTGRPFVDPVKSRWFNDLNFRRAVAHAMNRQFYVDSVLQGLGQIQHSVFSPASPFYLSPEEGLPTYDYNPEKARQLLSMPDTPMMRRATCGIPRATVSVSPCSPTPATISGRPPAR